MFGRWFDRLSIDKKALVTVGMTVLAWFLVIVAVGLVAVLLAAGYRLFG